MGIAEILRINERFSKLMRAERISAGHSINAVAHTFNLNPAEILRWELGASSPPAKIFYRIVRHYGSAATKRAAKMDLEIQLERYALRGTLLNLPPASTNLPTAEQFAS